MAALLSNQSLFASSPCSSSLTSRPFKTLKPKFQPLPSLSYANLRHLVCACRSFVGFANKCSLGCNVNRRSIFKSYFAAQDPISNTNDEREDVHRDIKEEGDEQDQYPLPSLMALIKAYREAIIYRDEETVSQIEAGIYSIANKRNQLLEKLSSLSEEKLASKEKCLRLQADFDNFRKRSEKERLNIQFDAQAEVIERLLQMVDNFDRAKQKIKPATEKEKKINTSYQGIYKQFVEVMRSHHVSAVATVGKPFDPSVHEAIAREESQDFKEGIIIQESRRGFLLRGRLLRPALVKVSSGHGNKKSTGPPGKSKEQPATAAGMDER
ncbi:hypothetical protein L6164_016127 [Bauhinia variegata]|uniref:Uncharacterized protein n=1 Tax=Bauhinia variegata TaxID=167791 RepID=A0ACB9NMQ0_BAUVA|nr:hypothetical protein L6164_016127 [Bauhinia variegata]